MTGRFGRRESGSSRCLRATDKTIEVLDVVVDGAADGKRIELPQIGDLWGMVYGECRACTLNLCSRTPLIDPQCQWLSRQLTCCTSRSIRQPSEVRSMWFVYEPRSKKRAPPSESSSWCCAYMYEWQIARSGSLSSNSMTWLGLRCWVAV